MALGTKKRCESLWVPRRPERRKGLRTFYLMGHPEISRFYVKVTLLQAFPKQYASYAQRLLERLRGA